MRSGPPQCCQPRGPRTRWGAPAHTEPCALAGEVVQGGVSLQVQLLQLTVLTALQHLQDTRLGQALPTQAGRTDVPLSPGRPHPPWELCRGVGGHCWRAGRTQFSGQMWCRHGMSPENSLRSPGGSHVWVRQGADTAVSSGNPPQGVGSRGQEVDCGQGVQKGCLVFPTCLPWLT